MAWPEPKGSATEHFSMVRQGVSRGELKRRTERVAHGKAQECPFRAVESTHRSAPIRPDPRRSCGPGPIWLELERIACLRLGAEIVRGLRGLGGRREDGPILVAEQLDPALDVARMPEFAGDGEMGTQECRGEFSDQLLSGIGTRAETAGEIAVEA